MRFQAPAESVRHGNSALEIRAPVYAVRSPVDPRRTRSTMAVPPDTPPLAGRAWMTPRATNPRARRAMNPRRAVVNLCAERARKSRIPVGLSMWIESWNISEICYFDRLFWVRAPRLGPETHPLRGGTDEATGVSNQRSSQQIEFASTLAAGTGGWAGEPSNAPITLVVGQIAPRVVTPRDMPTTTERLRARWARTGEGPALEARLRAAEAELARRERARV